MCLRPIRLSFWTRIMSAVEKLVAPSSPVQTSTTGMPEERPRKRRRKTANKTGFVKPENRNAALFQKGDWIIDGPYRRVPPYYYVFISRFWSLCRHITHGLKSGGIIRAFSKYSALNSVTDNLITTAPQLPVAQSPSTAKS